MFITLESHYDRLLGQCWAVFSEKHDGILYRARTPEQAVAAFEKDQHVKVTQYTVAK